MTRSEAESYWLSIKDDPYISEDEKQRAHLDIDNHWDD